MRRDNGWFGGADKAPSIPLDADVISEEDLSIYTAALARNGFYGPDSWYMNGAANIAYAAQAKNVGKLMLPVLFLHGACDYTCETIDSRLAEPMRLDCADLTEVVYPPATGWRRSDPRRSTPRWQSGSPQKSLMMPGRPDWLVL